MARDARVESLLKRLGYKNVYAEREPFSNIDLKASEANPARLKRKIDDLTVTKYACAMLDGAVFPAVVLLRQDGGKHLVATGMHRIKAAMEIKRDVFDAYIITEPDQYRFDLLIRLLNGVEGRGDTIKEQLWHVISLHEKYDKHSLTELAKIFDLAKQTVQSAWSEYKGVLRASRLGFDFEGTQKQPQNTIIALDRIGTDLVYTKAAEFVVHFDVPGRDVEQLVQELKAVHHKGESEEIAIIKKYHDIAAERLRRSKTKIKTPSTACTRLIGRCRSVNKEIRRGIEQLHLVALGDYRDAVVTLEDLIDNLGKVKAEIERIERLSGRSVGGSGFAMAAAPAV